MPGSGRQLVLLVPQGLQEKKNNSKKALQEKSIEL